MFSNVEYFLVIIKCGTLSTAAKKLGISQPALSGYLKKLEGQLGFSLFDRSTNPLALTELGKVYYSYVKKSLTLEAELAREIEDFDEQVRSKISIAGAVSTNIFFLSDVMSEYLKEFPNSQVEIIDGKVSDIFDLAADNSIDFFITPDVRQDTVFEYIPLIWERVIISVPANWEINDELKEYRIPIDDLLNGSVDYDSIKAVTFNSFRKSTFALLNPDTNIRKISDRVFEDNNYEPKHFVQVDQMLTSYYMTLRNSGISFVTDSMVSSVKWDEYPCFYKLEGDYLKRMLYICYKKDRYLSKTSKKMIELLKSRQPGIQQQRCSSN